MRVTARMVMIGIGLALVAVVVLSQKKADKPVLAQAREDWSREGKLKVGDMAPNFTLASLDGKQKVTLRTFRGKRPVALIFGSYT